MMPESTIQTSSKSDAVLIVWVIVSLLWDVLVSGTIAYVVFWRGRSGWWFLLLIILCYNPTLYQGLAKRFGLSGERLDDS